MQIDLTEIFRLVITLLCAVVTGFLIPFLRSKISVEKGNITQLQYDMLQLAASTAVTAAEQIYKSDEGQKKKAYVLAYLEQQGYKVDSSAIDALIEACVLELHQAIGKKE